MQVSK